MKNTGDKEWPSAFKIQLLDVSSTTSQVEISKDDLVISNNSVQKTVKPGNQFNMEIVLKNPGVAGEYSFVFSMSTVTYMPFGDPFEFKLHVKGSNKL